jgi:hypothetical protein
MRSILRATTASLCVLTFGAACSDSSGPGNVGPSDALRSLSLEIGGIADPTSPGAATLSGSLDALEPLLSQVNVSIDGASTTMFALGVKESFPAGTCEENVFLDPSLPPIPGECTPISIGTLLVLWQSHSASAPPDRLIVIGADEGTNDFSFLSSDPLSDVSDLSAFAVYIEGLSSFWFSDSGTLTSAVSSTGQSCALPLPPYATSATCSFASFDEQGSISFASEDESSTAHRTLTISRQSLSGIWEQITGTQPITISNYTTLGAAQSRRSARALLLAARDRLQRSSRP